MPSILQIVSLGGGDAPTLLSIVASSALTGAMVTLLGTGGFKLWDNIRADNQTKLKLDHVRLGVALQLEAYCQRSSAYISRISLAVSEANRLQDDSELGMFQIQHFAFDPEPDWTGLTLQFAADVRGFPRATHESDLWFEATDAFGDAFEAAEFRRQHACLHGLDAANRARAILSGIGVEPKTALKDYERHFLRELEELREKVKSDEDRLSLLPELDRYLQTRPAQVAQ